MTTGPVDILIVDDHHDLLRLVQVALVGRRDLVLRTASTAEQGLQRARERPPDLALLDLQLPDLPGPQLARRLHELVPRCQLYALTGFDPQEARRRTGDAPFLDVLLKPSDLPELIALFDDLVARARRDLGP